MLYSMDCFTRLMLDAWFKLIFGSLSVDYPEESQDTAVVVLLWMQCPRQDTVAKLPSMSLQ